MKKSTAENELLLLKKESKLLYSSFTKLSNEFNQLSNENLQLSNELNQIANENLVMRKKLADNNKIKELVNPSFIELLHLKLSKVGTAIKDKFSDGSGSWVVLKRDNKEIHFIFDNETENLDRVEVWEDIIEVVSTKKIF